MSSIASEPTSAAAGLTGDVFALVDCNAFYASCERLFRPDLRGRPVVVLSNNDGCIVAASAEAKAVGLRTGQPLFQVQERVRQCGAVVFSSNYAFYGDMSRRVVAVLSRFAAALEQYSIDECFLQIPALPLERLQALAREIIATVQREVGLPVCVGIGPSKTLAKAANRLAKGNPALGGAWVFSYQAEERLPILENLPVEEVWGLGEKRAARLQAIGVRTAGDLVRCPDALVRRLLSVVGLRLAYELRGFSCLALEEVPEPRKSIISSRSFGRPLTELAAVEEAVSAYACRAAEKLRQQRSVCHQIEVFLSTNRFRPATPQYRNAMVQTLPGPTADSSALSRAAGECLRQIWREGFAYHKAGVVLWDLRPESVVGTSLFGREDYPEKKRQLMRVMDALNARYGRGAVRLASSGLRRSWKMRQANLSPSYTTDWHHLPIVRAY